MSDVGPAQVQPLGNGRFVLHRDGRATPAYAVVDGASAWVWIDGFSYVVRGDAEAGTSQAGAGAVELASPMPATVRSIPVTAGQHVEAGDVLVVLEAMKMELPVRAPRAGNVRTVRCREGEIVQPGVPLVELD